MRGQQIMQSYLARLWVQKRFGEQILQPFIARLWIQKLYGEQILQPLWRRLCGHRMLGEQILHSLRRELCSHAQLGVQIGHCRSFLSCMSARVKNYRGNPWEFPLLWQSFVSSPPTFAHSRKRDPSHQSAVSLASVVLGCTHRNRPNSVVEVMRGAAQPPVLPGNRLLLDVTVCYQASLYIQRQS